MRFKIKKKEHRKQCLLLVAGIIFALIPSIEGRAQELPPRPIVVTVSTLQNLNFGAFAILPSYGGTITVYADGTRQITGDIVGLSYITPSAALFQIQANIGTQISILTGSGTGGVLTGSNGGTITVEVVDSYPVTTFVTNAVPPATTSVTVGGILTLEPTSTYPAGDYIGNFYVTFEQQ